MIYNHLINIDIYLIAFGINDYFYDVIFGLDINNDTYNFEDKEYLNNYKKILFSFFYTLCNIIFLLFCFFCLIFIEIPLIKYKRNPNKKSGKKLKEKIDNNEEQFDINERFTAEPI